MKYAGLIVLAVVAIGAGMYSFMAGEPDAPPGQARGGPGGFGAQEVPLVTIAEVRREQLYDIVEAIGTAHANESVTLTAKVTDTVRSVDFEDGDYVEAGSVLLQLTNEEKRSAPSRA